MKVISRICFLLLIFSCCSVFAEDIPMPENLTAEQKNEWKQIEKRRDEFSAGLFTPIVFYGKLLDQNDNPIPNTPISISTEAFTPNPLLLYSTTKKTLLSTDANGCFTYKGKGRMIVVFTRPTEDYAYVQNPIDRFFYAQTAGEREKIIHKPDKNNPVIFRMRKMEKPEIATRFEYEVRGMAPGKTYYSDMFYTDTRKRKVASDETDKINMETFHPQVKIYQTYQKVDEKTHIFTLKMEFFGDIQLQDGNKETLLLPVDGYNKKHFEATYKVENYDSSRECYLLSPDGKWNEIDERNPTFVLFAKVLNKYYAKVELTWYPFFFLKNEWYYLDLYMLYRINTVPGSRVFEDDSSLRVRTPDVDLEKLDNGVRDEFYPTLPSLAEILPDAAQPAPTTPPTDATK